MPQTASFSQALTAVAWQPNNPYQRDDLVSYAGINYRCLQTHTSQVGWEPPNVAALWAFESQATAAPPPTATTEPPATLTLDYVTVGADCNVSPESCCPAGSVVLRGTAGSDRIKSKAPNECIIAQAGRDTVSRTASGQSALLLGPGDDTAMDGPGDDFISGGPGDDTINAYGGTNLLFGGPGRDTLYAANGTNHVVPGPGADVAALGNGDDTLYIFDLCEVERGETLNGGAGVDTLVTPVPLAELAALGVTVSGFETVLVQHNTCRSECVPKASCSVGDVRSCADAIRPRDDLTGRDKEVALQEDILRYCTGVGIEPCLASLIARFNVDDTAAAWAVIAGTLAPSPHIAFARDRSRKLHRAMREPDWALKLCEGNDADDDWVPDPSDECPGTPDRAPTFDNGCTDPHLPAAPDGDLLRGMLSKMGLVFNKDCAGALPQVPRAVGILHSGGPEPTYRAITTSAREQPSNCQVWYQFEYRTRGRVSSSIFAASDQVRHVPDGVALPHPSYMQFPAPKDVTISSITGPDRFRVRLLNAAGLRSDWSEWWLRGDWWKSGIPNTNDCRALFGASAPQCQ